MLYPSATRGAAFIADAIFSGHGSPARSTPTIRLRFRSSANGVPDDATPARDLDELHARREREAVPA
jgi:hypothetical protein